MTTNNTSIWATVFSPPAPTLANVEGFDSVVLSSGDLRIHFASIDQLRAWVDAADMAVERHASVTA